MLRGWFKGKPKGKHGNLFFGGPAILGRGGGVPEKIQKKTTPPNPSGSASYVKMIAALGSLSLPFTCLRRRRDPCGKRKARCVVGLSLNHAVK